MTRKLKRPETPDEWKIQKKPNGKYADEDKQKGVALLAAVSNYRDTAAALGVPVSTLQGWALHDKTSAEAYRKYKEVLPDLIAIQVAEKIVESRIKLVEKMLLICHDMADVMSDKRKQKELSIRDAAVGLGIAVDKIDKVVGIGLKDKALAPPGQSLNVQQMNINLSPEERAKLEKAVGDAFLSLEPGEYSVQDVEIQEEPEDAGSD